MSKQWRVVQEAVEHGDAHHVRYVPTDLSAESVESMLNDCPYLRLPEFSDDAVLTSRTREGVLSRRAAEASRVSKELVENGTSEIGWVTYHVARKIHAPLLQAAGFDREFINEALA